jgi:hypothetical protein
MIDFAQPDVRLTTTVDIRFLLPSKVAASETRASLIHSGPTEDS